MNARELSVLGDRKKSRPADQRSGRCISSGRDASGPGKREGLKIAARGNPAECVHALPIGFEVGNAEPGDNFTRLQAQRNIHETAGILGVKWPLEERFIGGVGGRVHADADGQGKDCDDGKAGIADHHARTIPHVLQNGLRKEHQIDLAHALTPCGLVAESNRGIAASFVGEPVRDLRSTVRA